MRAEEDVTTRIDTSNDSAFGRRPLYPTLLQFPIVCFTLTLVTDVVYWGTANLMWHNFSSWLLLAGNVSAVLAGVVAILEHDFHSSRRGLDGPLAIGGLAAFGLSILNSLVHAGDGWTAIVPWGLTLSVATVLVILVTAVVRRTMPPRQQTGGLRHG